MESDKQELIEKFLEMVEEHPQLEGFISGLHISHNWKDGKPSFQMIADVWSAMQIVAKEKSDYFDNLFRDEVGEKKYEIEKFGRKFKVVKEDNED